MRSARWNLYLSIVPDDNVACRIPSLYSWCSENGALSAKFFFVVVEVPQVVFIFGHTDSETTSMMCSHSICVRSDRLALLLRLCARLAKCFASLSLFCTLSQIVKVLEPFLAFENTRTPTCVIMRKRLYWHEGHLKIRTRVLETAVQVTTPVMSAAGFFVIPRFLNIHWWNTKPEKRAYLRTLFLMIFETAPANATKNAKNLVAVATIGVQLDEHGPATTGRTFMSPYFVKKRQ